VRRDRAGAGHCRSRLHSGVSSGRDDRRPCVGCEPDADRKAGLDAEVQREATRIERDRAHGDCPPDRETDCDRHAGCRCPSPG
jgi:hypothetical protein